jgi:hypothetical protein
MTKLVPTKSKVYQPFFIGTEPRETGGVSAEAAAVPVHATHIT